MKPLQIVVTKNKDGYKIGVMGLDDKGDSVVLRNHCLTDPLSVSLTIEDELSLLCQPR